MERSNRAFELIRDCSPSASDIALAMKDGKGLAALVQSALASVPPSFESVGVAFEIIKLGGTHLGGVANAGLVLPGQLARFKRSIDWRSDSPGRRMTIPEAPAFID
jgi:hypothetical protein